MKTTAVQRITILAKELGLSINGLSAQIGVNQSTLATAISRDKGIGYEILSKIVIAYPSVSASWLLTGNGEMFVSTTPESAGSKILPEEEITPSTMKEESESLLDTMAKVRLKELSSQAEIEFLREQLKSRDIQIEKLLTTLGFLIDGRDRGVTNK